MKATTHPTHKTNHGPAVTHKNEHAVLPTPAPTPTQIQEDWRPRLEALERKVEELAKRETPAAQVIYKGNS
jgi:hypothetical protein